MAAEYGGVIGLAQTTLAMNMAYIALDRFRYRTKIQDKFKAAQLQTADMPPEYLGDLAWHNVQSIAAGDDVRSWTEGRFGYWCYWPIRQSLDRAFSYLFAVVSALVIFWRACVDVMSDGKPVDVAGIVDGALVTLLTLGLISPIVWVFGGRYAVSCAERSIEANMKHLTERVRAAAQVDVRAKLDSVSRGDGAADGGSSGQSSN